MTILPKKPKPPHVAAQAAAQGSPGSAVGQGPQGAELGSEGHGEDPGPGDDQQEQNNVVVAGPNGAAGWGPPGFNPSSPGQSDWQVAGGGSSSPSWPGSQGGFSGGGPVHPPPPVMVTAEKRPAPSSVSAYGFDDEDEDSGGRDVPGGGSGVGGGGGVRAAQCQPSASKRSRRSIGKRLKGSPLAQGPAAVAKATSNPSAASVQGAVAAALSRPPVTPSPPRQGCSSWGNADGSDEVDQSGYNSEDEYSHLGVNLTQEEWEVKDRRFEKAIRKKGYIIKPMVEDGSCLFRAVADQVFGDQEMHNAVRSHCMDYILQNSDYFGQYITEDIETYVDRKRYQGVHGNHLEIQALSEMYNRPIHIFSYGNEPINIFQTLQKSDKVNAPIRLSYHRGSHYNSLVDPHKATIGVGLGLPGHSPGSADRQLVRQAVSASEETAVEKAMLEDKLKATDWEATNEAIEEQVARESYLQWLKDNEKRSAAERKAASATVTSGELRSAVASAQSQLQQHASCASPKACCSKVLQLGSPMASKPTSPVPPVVTERGSPIPCSSTSQSRPPQQQPSTSSGMSSAQQQQRASAALGLGEDFRLNETESFMDNLPPDMFGLEDWGERDALLAQVLAASQQEYFESLRRRRQERGGGADSSSASSSPANSRPDTPK